MNVQEAENIVIKLEQKSVTTEEEEFQLVEALTFLFNETKKCEPIVYLGGYYYGKRNFDLALKYYDMGAGLGFTLANLYLGYIWYYGRTGERDYKKAFECFDAINNAKIGTDHEHGEVSEDDKIEANLKIADMYKNGYFVEKDFDKYKSIINKLFKNMKDFFDDHNVFKKYVEVGLRKARIYEEEGKIDDALNLYFVCKEDLAFRLRYNLFFGDVNQMSWVIDDIYRLMDFDPNDFDLYDLFYFLKQEHKVQFLSGKKVYVIESKEDKDGMSYRLEDKWFHTFNELILKADIKDESLPLLQDAGRIDRWTVLK